MRLFSKRPFAAFLATFLLSSLLIGIAPRMILLPVIITSIFISSVGIILAFFIHARQILLRISAGFLALGLAASVLFFYSEVFTAPLREKEGCVSAITLQIESVPCCENYLTVINGTLVECDGCNMTYPVRAETNEKWEVHPGDVVCTSARIHVLCATEEEDVALYRYGITALLTECSVPETIGTFHSLSLICSELRAAITDRIFASAPGDAGALYAALLLGEKDALDNVTRVDFSRLGISHMLAISGLHLSVLILFLNRLLQKLGLSGKIRSVIGILLTLAYMALTGFPASICRAGIMLILAFLSYLIGRTRDTVTSLLFAVALFCFVRPFAVYDVGLWLSATATFALLLDSEWKQTERPLIPIPETERKIPRKGTRIFKPILSSVIVSTLALVATLPITAIVFGEVSPLSIPANLLFGIPITLAIACGIIAAIFGGCIPFLGTVLRGYGEWLLWAVKRVAAIPHCLLSLEYPWAKWIVLVMGIAVLLILVLCKQSKRPIIITVSCCLSLLAVLIGIRTAVTYDRAEMTYLGESSGCYLLVKDSFRIVVYDASAGNSGLRDRLAAQLRIANCTEIDEYIVSDYSYRTTSNLVAILGKKHIRHLFLPTPSTDIETARMEEALSAIQKYDIPFTEYSGDFPISFGETELLLFRESDEKTGSSSAVLIRSGEASALFLSPAYPLDRLALTQKETAEQIRNCTILIVGGKGNAQNRLPTCLSYEAIESVVIGNANKINQQELMYLLPENTEIILENGPFTFRLRH